MKNCPFCKIVDGRSAIKPLYADRSFLVFSPQKKISKGHVLIVPKRHFRDIFEINDRTVAELFILAKKISVETVKKTRVTGINLLHASGRGSQQSVFHFHVHLVPRRMNDNLDLWPEAKIG